MALTAHPWTLPSHMFPSGSSPLPATFEPGYLSRGTPQWIWSAAQLEDVTGPKDGDIFSLLELLRMNLRFFNPINPSLFASQAKRLRLVIGDVKPLASVMPIVIVEAEGVMTLEGLNTPNTRINLFANHLPMYLRHYPLVATPQWSPDMLSHPVSAQQLFECYQMHYDKRCFHRGIGYELMEADGSTTPYLERMAHLLNDTAIQVRVTDNALKLLKKANALEKHTVEHLGERVCCYLVNERALDAPLIEKCSSTSNYHPGQAIAMAFEIAHSQQQLGISITT